MAITKIHAIKSTLGKALAYIENPDKTDGQMLVSGYNCEPQTASIDFEMTAVLAHKARNLKRQRSTNLAYHLIQSFSPEDAVTPEQAHELGKKLAFEYTGGKYEYVVATHIDKGHIHNHIMINAVSFYDYKKLRTVPYRTARQIRDISDRLCMEAHLSVIDDPQKIGQLYPENAGKKKSVSNRTEIRKRLNFCLERATDYSQFLSMAKELEITPTIRGKHMSYLLEGAGRAVVAYSIAISIALASMTGNFQAQNVLRPIIMNLFAFALGGVFGLILKFLLHKRSTDNRLIVSIALLFAFCGICALMGVSSLLGCMSMSMIYINTSDDERLFKQLNYFSPPLLLLFFVRSGLNFDLDAIFSSSDHIGSASLLAVGVVYFVTRILGKYSGAFLGCLLARKNKKVRNNLGLALIPQAGVAIGLAAMGARTLGGAMGDALETIILASSVLYELIGPACAKLSLYLSGSYSNRLDDIVTETVKCDEHEPENEVERLIRQIQAIQKELPAHNDPFLEDEQAYDEAAYEHYALTGYPQVSYQNTRRKADIWTL